MMFKHALALPRLKNFSAKLEPSANDADQWSMKLSMTVREYLISMTPQANKPLSLSGVLMPFRIAGDEKPSPDLLHGHLLDALIEQFTPADRVDAMDIATVAYELGLEVAGDFLELAPLLLSRLAIDCPHEASYLFFDEFKVKAP